MKGSELEELRRDWERLGEVDPFWAVLTDPGRKGGGWQPDEFFATGEREIASVLETAGDLGLPERRMRALDFGCGVGRLTRALSSRFDDCVGVDISAAMIERARDLNSDRPNIVFLVNAAPNLATFAAGEFDFVYSSLVLQHLPSRALIADYVADLVRVTGATGLLVFQLPTSAAPLNRLQLARRVYGLLRRAGVSEATLLRRTSLTPMRMTHVPEPDARRLVEAAGGAVALTEPLGASGLRYYVRSASSR